MANGIWEGMKQAPGLFLGGQNNPALSGQQNEQAQRQAMLLAGLQGMMASRGNPGGPAPGTLQILAQMGLTGQQVGAQARQGMVQQQALQNPALMQGMSPQQQAIFQQLAAANPEAAMQLGVQRAFAPRPEPVVVDGNLVDPSTGRVIFSAPEDPEISKDLTDFLTLRYGIDPQTLSPQELRNSMAEYQKWLQTARPSTQVNVDARERQVERGLTEIDLDRIREFDKAASDAAQQRSALSTMDSLLQSGMTTSKLDSLTMPLRQVAAGFGIESENLGRQELFQGLSNELALLKKGNMTGQMSDRDIIFLQRQAPQLANSVQGNRLMVDVLRRAANLKIEAANEADRYVAERGTTTGLRTHMRDWLAENEITIDDLLQQYGFSRQGGVQAPWKGN